MTTIAAVEGDGWAVIGFDSRVSTMLPGGRIYTMPTTSNGKIVRNGEYLIGAAGDLRILNIIGYAFKPPTPPRGNTNLDKFIITTFIPALRLCFEEHGVSLKENGTGADLIVALRGRIYEIGEGFEWCADSKGIYAVGSGSTFALGSLYTTLGGKKYGIETAKKAVKLSLEIASSLDSGTGLPIVITTQE